MEALPYEALSRVAAFVGEPDSGPRAPPCRPVFEQLFAIANVGRALLAWYKYWRDNEMALEFHA